YDTTAHQRHVATGRVRGDVADRVLRERLGLLRPIDEDEDLRRGEAVGGPVAVEGELPLDARPAESREGALDARRERGIGGVRVAALGSRVNAVIEPRAVRVPLEAMQPPGVGDLDRAQLLDRNGQ